MGFGHVTKTPAAKIFLPYPYSSALYIHVSSILQHMFRSLYKTPMHPYEIEYRDWMGPPVMVNLGKSE